jgi:hypothetical protein
MDACKKEESAYLATLDEIRSIDVETGGTEMCTIRKDMMSDDMLLRKIVGDKGKVWRLVLFWKGEWMRGREMRGVHCSS